MTIRRIAALTGSVALLLAGCAAETDTAGGDDEGADAAVEAPVSDSDEAESSDEAADAEESEAADAEETDDAEESEAADVEETDDAAADHADDDGSGDAEVAAADDDVDRVVEIDMDEMEFSVEELEFSVGERVRFDFVNVGQAPHEALIGDLHVQEEHEQEMAEGADHHEASDDGHEGDLTTISLEPGNSGSFVHEFTEAGELWMGCHVPGHWGAGMRTRITVSG